MKKLLTIALALVLSVSLFSCAGGDASSKTQASSSTTKNSTSSSTSTVVERNVDDYMTQPQGSLGNDTYKYVFTENYTTLNYLTSMQQHDSDFFANFVDGLVETNRFGEFVPALEASHTVSDPDENGYTTWTFKLKDAVWSDSKGNLRDDKGEAYGYVTPEDFYTAAKYILEPKNSSQTTSMWFQFIAGAQDWYSARYVVENYAAATDAKDSDGNVTATKAEVQQKMLEVNGFASFDEAQAVVDKGFDNVVGVHYTADTLTYVVNGQKPYFYSALTYAPFLPVNSKFLQKEGESFGVNKDSILYCGGYTLNEYTAGSTAKLVANKYYWDASHVYVRNVELIYNSLLENSTTRILYENGTIDGFAVSSKDDEGWKKYVVGEDGTEGTVDNPVSTEAFSARGKGDSVFSAYFNFDRDGGKGVNSDNPEFGNWSKHTPKTYANTKKAIGNADFRLAFTYGIDFVQYLKDFYGETTGLGWMNRSWTCPGLCSATVDGVTKDYTWFFAKEYADNNPGVTVEEAYKNLFNTADKDIVYSVDAAQAHLLKAYTDLKAQGVTFPVKVEISGAASAEDQAVIEAFAKRLEQLFTVSDNGTDVDVADIVVIKPANANDEQNLYYGGYLDFNRFTGWGADYADPLTYLHCWVDGGDLYSNLGIDSNYLEGIVANYTALVKAADKIVDSAERYAAFAKAEYDLIFKEAIIVPFLNVGSTSVRVSKVLPYTSLRASCGLSDAKYKDMVIADSSITQEQYQSLKTAFNSGDAKALEAAIQAIVLK